MESWTFLTNHAHVLLCIARDPEVRLREVAEQVGITERAAQRIVADLVAEGYVTRTKVGRRNHYHVYPERPIRHPVDYPTRLGTLLGLLVDPAWGFSEDGDDNPVGQPAAPTLLGERTRFSRN